MFQKVKLLPVLVFGVFSFGIGVAGNYSAKAWTQEDCEIAAKNCSAPEGCKAFEVEKFTDCTHNATCSMDPFNACNNAVSNGKDGCLAGKESCLHSGGSKN